MEVEEVEPVDVEEVEPMEEEEPSVELVLAVPSLHDDRLLEVEVLLVEQQLEVFVQLLWVETDQLEVGAEHLFCEVGRGQCQTLELASSKRRYIIVCTSKRNETFSYPIGFKKIRCQFQKFEPTDVARLQFIPQFLQQLIYTSSFNRSRARNLKSFL